MSDFSDCDSEDDRAESQFSKASEHVQRICGTLQPNELLTLYALYKQASVGPCNTAKPNIFNMQARAKWSAWQELGALESHLAKERYVAKVEQLDSNWKGAASSKSLHSWVVHSVELPPQDELALPEDAKTLVDYVKEQNVQRVRELLPTATTTLDQLDAHGMGLLHWATDRNACEILECLLAQGADVNLRDSEGQTALHYAASCAHVDCLRFLLKYGGDRTLLDDEQQTCIDVAEDDCIRQLLMS